MLVCCCRWRSRPENIVPAQHFWPLLRGRPRESATGFAHSWLTKPFAEWQAKFLSWRERFKMRIAIDGFPLSEPLTGIGHYTLELAHHLALNSPEHEILVVS